MGQRSIVPLVESSSTVKVKKVFRSGDHPRIYIPRLIVKKTAEHLRKYGAQGNEGLVFWAGIEVGDGSKFVTTCVYPRVRWASGASVSSDVIAGAEVVREVRRRGLEIIAEIHSHPGHWVGHSIIDDKNPFVLAKGNISIVVPCLGDEGMEPLWKCGVYLYSVKDGWRRLSKGETVERFVVVDEEIALERG
jgi:hypothetical protein